MVVVSYVASYICLFNARLRLCPGWPPFLALLCRPFHRHRTRLHLLSVLLSLIHRFSFCARTEPVHSTHLTSAEVRLPRAYFSPTAYHWTPFLLHSPVYYQFTWHSERGPITSVSGFFLTPGFSPFTPIIGPHTRGTLLSRASSSD